jgi:hypothetical protein
MVSSVHSVYLQKQHGCYGNTYYFKQYKRDHLTYLVTFKYFVEFIFSYIILCTSNEIYDNSY